MTTKGRLGPAAQQRKENSARNLGSTEGGQRDAFISSNHSWGECNKQQRQGDQELRPDKDEEMSHLTRYRTLTRQGAHGV